MKYRKECVICGDFEPQYVNSLGDPLCKQCVEMKQDVDNNMLLDTSHHIRTSGETRFLADKGKFKPMSLNTYNKYEWDYYDSSEQPIGIGEWGMVLDDNGSTPLYMIICNDDGDYTVIDMYLVRKRLVELEGESHYLPDWLNEVKESKE